MIDLSKRVSEFVFILGAGFSKPAGAPLMANFLERAEQLIGSSASLQAVSRAISELQIAHSKADLDLYDLEAVFGIFEMARLIPIAQLPALQNENAALELISSLKAAIAETLEVSTLFPRTAPIPEYLSFAELIGGLNHPTGQFEHRCSILTFNYDLIVDHTLLFGYGYDYCLNDGAPTRTPLLKLHGSLNWASCECGEITPWHIGSYLQDRRFLDADRIRLPLSTRLNEARLSHCGKNVGSDPVIVPPTWSKADHHHAIAKVWRRAAGELANAENIFVIGYSLPQSDAFFRYLYALGAIGDQLIKRFWVFNPDAATKSRFEELLGKAVARRFRFSQTPFPDCVREIKNELKGHLT
jgi:hypothetical protein